MTTYATVSKLKMKRPPKPITPTLNEVISRVVGGEPLRWIPRSITIGVSGFEGTIRDVWLGKYRLHESLEALLECDDRFESKESVAGCIDIVFVGPRCVADAEHEQLIANRSPTKNETPVIRPILKSSPEITRTKGDTDERSIREKFSGLIASQAGKAAEELPKPKRVVDPKAVARVRAWGRCQKCEKSKRTNKKVRLHVAHIKSRSAGGGDTDDNLVLLCSVCHQNSHQIGNPSREEMILMAEDRARRQRVALSAFAAEKLVKEQTEEGKP